MRTPARQVRGGARALPVQDGAAVRHRCFSTSATGSGLRATPLQPPVHLAHVCDTKAQAGEHALVVLQQRAHPVRRRR